MPNFVRPVFCVLVLAFLPACEVAPAEGVVDTEATGDDGVPEGPCVPGQSIACGCGGRMGAATCRADGSGYEACSCDGAGEDEAGGPGASASETDAETTADASGPDGESGDSGGPAGVSWTNDIVPLLASSCGAEVVGCHHREVYNPDVEKGCLHWVSFEDALLGSVFTAGERKGQPTGCPDLPLYERVVNRSPWQCGAFFNDPQAVLVVPGDPDESYVIQKIRGITCSNTLQMPPEGQNIQITEAEVDMLIEWIEAGAPYDG
jgi:hypothetical protein